MATDHGSILLVDDEEKILKALGRALREAGHDVVETTSPKRAQRLLSERTFDLLVVTPDNYAPRERPWRPELDPLLRSVWRHDEGGERVAELYELLLP